jgi:hypothetical protein
MTVIFALVICGKSAVPSLIYLITVDYRLSTARPPIQASEAKPMKGNNTM